jgi:type I restriction enzyme M protein
MNTSSLVQKVWNFCHTLRDDGVGYGDYLEQLTYLLFLKLAHEYAQEPYKRDTHIPSGYDWASLTPKVGEPLEAHYLAVLHKLGQEPGMLGAIFFKAQNKIQDPAKLSRLVQMIDAENWISSAWMPTPRAIFMKDCCKRTRKTPRVGQVSISRHVR